MYVNLNVLYGNILSLTFSYDSADGTLAWCILYVNLTHNVLYGNILSLTFSYDSADGPRRCSRSSPLRRSLHSIQSNSSKCRACWHVDYCGVCHDQGVQILIARAASVFQVGGMPYYRKLQLLVGAPLVLSFVFCAISFVWHMVRSHYQHKRDLIKLQAASALRRINEASGANVVARKNHDDGNSQVHASHYKIKMRASAKRGMFRCISIVALVMDVCYPSVSRCVLQLFRCRELGTPSSSRLYLEADYNTPVNVSQITCVNLLHCTAMGPESHSC